MNTGQRVFGIKVFGVLNLVFSAVGLWVALQTIAHPGHLLESRDSPFLVEAFYTMTALNLLFVLAIALSGVFLLIAGVRGIAFANVVFMAEVLYFVASLWPVSGQVGHSITEAYGIGNVAIMAQMVVGYPLVALVVLNLVRNRLRKSSAM